jgi:hypothetical protein
VLWARVLRRTNSTERIIRLEGRLYSVLIVQNALHCLDTGGFWLAYELKENVVMILLLFVFEIAGNGTPQLCIVFPFPTQDSMPANISRAWRLRRYHFYQLEFSCLGGSIPIGTSLDKSVLSWLSFSLYCHSASCSWLGALSTGFRCDKSFSFITSLFPFVCEGYLLSD